MVRPAPTPRAAADPLDDEPGRWARWRQRRAARRAAPYPGPLRRIGSAIALVVVVTIAGLAVALTTGLVVVALLVLVDRALAT